MHTVFQAWTFLIWFHFKAHAGTAHVSHCLPKLRHTQSHTTGWHLSKRTCGKIILELTWKPLSSFALILLVTHWWKGYKCRAVWLVKIIARAAIELNTLWVLERSSTAFTREQVVILCFESSSVCIKCCSTCTASLHVLWVAYNMHLGIKCTNYHHKLVLRSAYEQAFVNKREALRAPCSFLPKEKLDGLAFENEKIQTSIWAL